MSTRIISTPDFASTGVLNPLFSIAALSYEGATQSRTTTNGQRWVLHFSCGYDGGSDPSPCQEAYAVVPSGYDADLDARGAVHRLTVTTPDDPTGDGQDIISATFELPGSSVAFDVREHPTFLALGPTVLQEINQAIEDKSESLPTSSDNEDAVELWNLLRERNGNASFFKSQFIYRVTSIVGSRYATQVAFANTHKRYSTAELIAETNPPSTVIFSLEAIEDNTVPDQSETRDGRYTYGWLKQTPQVTALPKNQQSIVNEYTLEVWNNKLYPAKV